MTGHRSLDGAHPSASDIAATVRRAGGAMDVVRRHLARIDAGNAAINALREVYAEAALRRAEAVDAQVARGEDPGPLAGVPVAIKDNIASRLGTTACGSRMLAGYASPFDATVVERMEAAGAIIIGRTNCDEFAMGSSTEHCAFGPVRNPHDHDRVPGGSSGGSAAAVAAGLVPVALGSDTGGSIRQPAALCGVVGLKPSYGRVSRYGLVAFGSSLDQIGPFTRTVADAALVLGVIAGEDPRDSTCAQVPVPACGATTADPVRGLRLGVPRSYLRPDNHPDVAESFTRAIDRFRAHGATIVPVDLDLVDAGIATYYVIAPAEASSNLARFDGIRYGHRATVPAGSSLDDLYAATRSEGFGREVQRRIMLGTYVLSAGYYDAFYRRALRVRRRIREEFDRAFVTCDAIIGPTTPTPAFRIGEKSDPVSMYLCDVYTVNTNIAGICGMSVPMGFAREGSARLPIGLHIQCPAFAEDTLLRVGRAWETLHDPAAPAVAGAEAAR